LGHCLFGPGRWAIGFWSSLFGGSNPTLNKDISQFGQIGGFATGLGEKNLTQASNFYSSLLSGDPSKIAKVLGPEISGQQQQTQQQRNVTSQFGTRGGGAGGSMQMAGDVSRGNINNMISSLLGSSASSLGSMGAGLLSQGQSAYGQQMEASQQQMQNWQNSIFGGALSRAARAGEGFAFGGTGGAMKAFLGGMGGGS
jgi:hypothetical protein